MKVMKVMLAGLLMAAIATPAMAEFKLNGYYRLKGYMAEARSGGGTVEGGYAADASDEKGDSRQLVDQRLRMMLTYTLNDNVAIVYHGEVDTVWGEQSKGNAGGGGKLGADGVNLETKNVYLDLKAGDTKARLGVQGIADAYSGIVFFDDMAAINVSHKIANTTLTGIYSKWDESDTDNNRSDWNDRDFYVLDLKQKISDGLTLGGSVYLADDNRNEGDTEVLFYGLNAAAKFDDFGVDGFVVMADGENKVTKTDVSGLAASARATMGLPNGNVNLRVMYFGEDDDATDSESWITPVGRYDFAGENLMQFLVDKFVCNYGKERYAMADAAEAGYGLLGFVLSGNHKLPSDMYANWGLGYFRSLEDERNDEAVSSREGKTLGYEVAVRIGKKYFDKVDVSLNASYAGYGNFYDNTAADGDDPDGTYKAYAMVNVPF